MISDKEIKRNSIKIRNLIKKEINKKIPTISESKFDVWKIITKEFAKEIDLHHFTAGNNDWGGNRLRITKHFHNKFIKDFRGKSFNQKGEREMFKPNIYKLLRLSETKTPQKSKKDRKIPFKQQTKYSQTYAIVGKETVYSNNHNPSNHYHYTFCNKTKIKFFKGPSEQGGKIIDNNWQKIFSDSFIYGYLLASVNMILNLGTFEMKEENPKERFSDLTAKFKKNIYTKLIYNKSYIRNLITEFYEKFYKINHNDSLKIFNFINDSVYKSKLSHFLLLKNENYFVYKLQKDFMSAEQDGTANFISSIRDKKGKYLGNSKDKRYTKVVLDTRKDIKKGIQPQFLTPGDGAIISYEQFRLYTLSLPFINPYNEKQINVNELDIFIRYAVNMGVQEILFYVMEKIFSPT
jgi:hypothetical protein|tara:strand:- start:62 stop:1279 length:1218 start_codon:yes stop_codon:yes gene_type:complete